MKGAATGSEEDSKNRRTRTSLGTDAHTSHMAKRETWENVTVTT